ncbi:MAG: hypothetical protein WBC05_25400 [Sedimentisphaerales bacterium]
MSYSTFFDELCLIINSYIVYRIAYSVSREGLSVSSDQTQDRFRIWWGEPPPYDIGWA